MNTGGSPGGARTRPAVGERRPPLQLRAAESQATVRWTLPARKATYLVFLHAPSCDNCHAYLERLRRHSADLQAGWDGRVFAVVPAAPDGMGRMAHLPAPGLSILADPDRSARRRYGVEEYALAGFVADRWGQIFDVVDAEHADDLPGPDALQSWFRFLATQCPECGVPDVPDDWDR